MRGDLEVSSSALAVLDISDPTNVPLTEDRTPTNLYVWDLTTGRAVDGSPIPRVADWQVDRSGGLKARSDLHIRQNADGSSSNSYYFEEWRPQTRAFVPYVEAASSGTNAPGEVLITAGDRPDSSRLVDRTSGQPLSEDFPSEHIYLPDHGCCIVIQSGDYSLEVRDLTTGKVLGSAFSTPPRSLQLADALYNSFTAVEYSPDDTTFLANAAGGGVTLYRTSDARALVHIDKAADWRFQENGDLLAVVTDTNVVELVSSSSGRPVASFAGLLGTVAGVWFGPDGRTIAAAASDGTVRIWQIPR